MTSPSSTQESKPVRFAAIGLDHGHVLGQVAGLIGAGAELVGMDTDDWSSPVATQARERWPDVAVRPAKELFEDESIAVITTAGIPDRRGPLAVEAMRHGKDVVVDKPGCTTLAQLDEIRAVVAETGRFWSVGFSERFGVRCVTRAGELVRDGRIGQVVQTIGLGPHRHGPRDRDNRGRPDWFYEKERYGGIIADIASHQIDQFLWFTGSTKAEVVASSVANYANPEHPGLQDFGDLLLRSDTAQGYIRCDWYTPDGLPTWGDGRLIILGTEGYLEMRKYVDIAGREGGNHLFCIDQAGTNYLDCSDVQLTYYDDLIHDVRTREETACPQQHTFETMRLALVAQEQAVLRGNAR
jgi:predicted dehydrogenase